MKILFSCLLFVIHWSCTGGAFDAIIEKQSAHFTLKSNARMEVAIQYTVKILTAAGDHHAVHEFLTDQIRSYKKYDIVVRDASGSQIARYNIKNFEVTQYIRSLAYFENIRRYKLDTRSNSYPYTLDINIEFYRIPSEYKWNFGGAGNTSVLQSDLYVTGNTDLPFKYLLEQDSLLQINDHHEGTIRTVHIGLKDPKLQLLRNMFSDGDKTIPSARITPLQFLYGKELCSLESWETFGKFIHNLWSGRQTLPPAAMADLDVIRGKYHDSESLARAVYAYVQGRFRYVYIGYGLGGLQAISAADTYKTGYGDCKGLSNFTNAAMNYVGVKSYSALIYGGSDPSNEDPQYVSDWFNHVVVCLPEIGDTTWLECTSQTNPFGYTSNSIDNRWAMLITETGGLMARTTKHDASDNFGSRNLRIEIMPDGGANISADLKYGGLAMENTSFYRREYTGEEPHRAFSEQFDIKSFDLKEYNCERYPNREPAIAVKTSATARLFGRKAGSKLLVSPFPLQLQVPEIDTLRKMNKPVEIKHGYHITDTIQIHLGSDYISSNLPEPLIATCDAGSFEVNYHLDESLQMITVVRQFIYHAGEYPKEKRMDLNQFFTKVKKSDETLLVLDKT